MARDMNLKADFSGGAQFKGSLLSKLLRANDELNGRVMSSGSRSWMTATSTCLRRRVLLPLLILLVIQ